MDRTLWARFGEATLTAPHAIQWLSDNGPQYTATASVLYAHELGLVPITTPAYSPQSNGLAEAFVGTFKRDYVTGAELRDAETVLAQLGGWIDDYNTQAPHSALGMRSPADYRAGVTHLAVRRKTASTPRKSPAEGTMNYERQEQPRESAADTASDLRSMRSLATERAALPIAD